MTYNLDWESAGTEGIPGKSSIIVPERTTDATSTSLKLTGKGTASYGKIQQENFIKLLENFASNTAPSNPTIGQLWFSPVDKALYLCVETATVTAETTVYFTSGAIGWVRAWQSSALGTIASDLQQEIVDSAAILQQEIVDAVAPKADVNSPALTGIPTSPTPIATTETAQVATTAFVHSVVNGVQIQDLTAHSGPTLYIGPEAAVDPIFIFNGVLTSDVTLIFPNTYKKVWTVINRTTGGSFRMFLKVLMPDGVNASLTQVEVLRDKAQQVFTSWGEIGSAVTHVPGTSENVIGVVAIANGGTGATDAATARVNLGISSAGTVNLTGDQTIDGNKTFNGAIKQVGNSQASVFVEKTGTNASLGYLYNNDAEIGVYDDTYGKIISKSKNAQISTIILGAPVETVSLLGAPTAPTPNIASNDTTIATTAFVTTKTSNIKTFGYSAYEHFEARGINALASRAPIGQNQYALVTFGGRNLDSSSGSYSVRGIAGATVGQVTAYAGTGDTDGVISVRITVTSYTGSNWTGLPTTMFNNSAAKLLPRDINIGMYLPYYAVLPNDCASVKVEVFIMGELDYVHDVAAVNLHISGVAGR